MINEMTWNEAKDHVVYQLHNVNFYDEKVLNKIKYYTAHFCEDIMMVFYVDLSGDLDGKNLIMITKNHLKKWGVDIETVADTAYKNFNDMDLLIGEYNIQTGEVDYDIELEDGIKKIYQTSCPNNVYGGQIAKNNVLSDLYNWIGSRFYFTLLDSNIAHIYPEYLIDNEVLEDINRTVNESIITHNIFYFNGEEIMLDDINYIGNSFDETIKSAS